MSYTSPNWKSSILITVDTQNDFTLPDAPAEIKGTYEVIPKMKELLTIFRENHLPVLHVIRLYMKDGSNVDICRRKAAENGLHVAIPDTKGAELVDELKLDITSKLDSPSLLKGEFQQIGSNESVMYKSRWGAFYKTNLEPFLLDKNLDTIIICGCNFPNCPRTTIYEASERDFRVVLAEDAMSQVYQKGIEEMTNIGVNVLKTSDIVEVISGLK
jgi:nicotinamidase-related amidase